METSELLKKVRKIEIKSKGLSNQIFSGEYSSTFKGRGMLFSEVREYMYGDDIKAIDWNVTARFGTPYIKIFEEERELTVMFLIDVSPSSFFGTINQMKHEIITEICAILAFSATNNNDKVGVIFFSDKIDLFIPPKKGKSHVLRIIRELLEFAYGDKSREREGSDEEQLSSWQRFRRLFKRKPANKKKKDKTAEDHTNIELALKYFSNVIKRKCIAFMLSDFMGSGYEKSLTLVSKKHDLIGIHLYDPREDELPNVGLIRVVDAETRKVMWLDTSDKKTRQKYSDRFRKNVQHCKSAFHRSGADLISIPTNRPYVKYLMNFFKKRGS